MKKLLIGAFAAVTVALCAVFPFSVTAQAINVELNGETLYTTAEPKVVNGRTLVPVRDIFNAVGADVQWNNSAQEITASDGSSTVKMYIGKNEYSVNNSSEKMDSAPQIINGRTYAPVRYAAEAYGYKVGWNNNTKTISLNGNQMNGLTVNYISIGQGDSTLISCDGHNMLIDAGDIDKGSFVKQYLSNKGVSSLDYVIATHPHADHIGGMKDVINTYQINSFIMPKVTTNTSTFENMLKALSAKNIKPTEAVVGSEYSLGSALFTVIAPVKYDNDNLNNCSVVIKLEYKGHRFIFQGDAEQSEESDIIGSGVDISSEVIKIGHHGSSTSSSQAYISAVNPQYAVISVGVGNSYGHPNQSTLSRLSSDNITVFRTDIDGNIIVRTNGFGYAITKTKALSGIAQSSDAKKSISIKAQSTNNSADKAKTSVVSNKASSTSGSGNTSNTTATYILNTNSKKVHYPSCTSAAKIAAKNKQSYTGRFQDLLAKGYTACGICKPN